MRLDEQAFTLLPYPIRGSAACSRAWGGGSEALSRRLVLVLMGGEARGALEPRLLPHGPLAVTASGWDLSHDCLLLQVPQAPEDTKVNRTGIKQTWGRGGSGKG